jgi:hypothetical protein
MRGSSSDDRRGAPSRTEGEPIPANAQRAREARPPSLRRASTARIAQSRPSQERSRSKRTERHTEQGARRCTSLERRSRPLRRPRSPSPSSVSRAEPTAVRLLPTRPRNGRAGASVISSSSGRSGIADQLHAVGHNQLQPALPVGGHSAGPHHLDPDALVHSTDVYGTVNRNDTTLSPARCPAHEEI